MTQTPIDGGLQPQGGTILPKGMALLTNPLLNKGTAFTEKEREALGLRGLLPPRIFTLEEQSLRAYGNFCRKTDPLEKYIFLTTLQNRNETLFYKLIKDHAEEMIPIIYTPTVGQACLEYSAIFRRPRGMFISLKDRGHLHECLSNWPTTDVRMIVVTDGERILGLGDLGVMGMGIPVGKLALYTACAGVHPYYCLPITLDVGTDNMKLHDDPVYLGSKKKRVRGEEYDAFIAEFVNAVKSAFPKALIQWEDFGNTNAFRILSTYREEVLSFNDDIQGTASVALAGLLGGMKLTGKTLRDQKILFLGAGEAGTGIADLFVAAAVHDGLTPEEARARCWFVDSKGLVVHGRGDKLAEHKEPYAHHLPFCATLEEAVNVMQPTALIGVSGTPRTFTPAIIARMAEINERPFIFALSNPTSKAECTAEEAYQHSNGRAIFASGSPFAPVSFKDQIFTPGQGNNVYIFPGVGFGVLAVESSVVTDGMFLTAARTLAGLVQQSDLDVGRVFPSLSNIREISLEIATAVADEAISLGHSKMARPEDLRAFVKSRMFDPVYRNYVP